MKKTIFLFSIFALLIITSCSKDNNILPTTEPDSVEIQIIDSISNLSRIIRKPLFESIISTNFIASPVTNTINKNFKESNGDSVLVTGSISLPEAAKGVSATINMKLNETFHNKLRYVADKTDSISGSISYIGNIILNADQTGTASFLAKGSINVVRKNYNKVIGMELTIFEKINSTKSFTIIASGAIGGKQVNYTKTRLVQ